MRILGRVVPALLLAASAGCGLVSASAPPDGGYFDVVGHPAGGIPASLGFYGGVAVWAPAGYVLSGILPEPVDEPAGRVPGEILGTAVGLVVGAPFHLLALPFGGGGTQEEAPPAEGKAEPR